jgi:hypothetical protein
VAGDLWLVILEEALRHHSPCEKKLLLVQEMAQTCGKKKKKSVRREYEINDRHLKRKTRPRSAEKLQRLCMSKVKRGEKSGNGMMGEA